MEKKEKIEMDELGDIIHSIGGIPYFEANDIHFKFIWSKLKKESCVAFNFCPNEYSQFGVVLSLIYYKKLTTTFSGLHPSINDFIFVAIQGYGGFGFQLRNRTEKFLDGYVSEKLGLSEEDAKGFCKMLNFFIND